MTTNHPAYRGGWQRIRREVLQRDNHLCQIRDTGCTTTATVVDHIIPVNEDPSGLTWHEPANLRAACRACNNNRIDRRRKAATPSRKW